MRSLSYLFSCLVLSCAQPSTPPEPAASPPATSAAQKPARPDNGAEPVAKQRGIDHAAPQGDADSERGHSQHDGAREHESEQQHAQAEAGYQMDFSEVERFARHFDDPKRDAWQLPEQVVGYLGLAKGQTVADLGAGTGYFLAYLSRAVGPRGKVLALDVEPNMVLYMQKRVAHAKLPNVEARRVAPDDPGLAPGSVDRILIVDTWHHIGQREAYAGKLRDALKPKGSLLVVDFTADSDIGPPKAHRLSADQVKSELAQGGLDAEVVGDEKLPKQYVVRGTRKAD